MDPAGTPQQPVPPNAQPDAPAVKAWWRRPLVWVIIAVIIVAAALVVVVVHKMKTASAPAGSGATASAPLTPDSPNWKNECIYTSDLAAAEANPTMVCSLNLFNQGLTQIPPQVFQMTNLQYLNLADNNITTVPPEIGNLTHLQRLYLNQNKITSLPSTLNNLTSLQFLSLEWDGVSVLTPNIASLKNLQAIVIMGNPLPPSEVTKVHAIFASASIIF